ncbi:MAG: efflux RND transporter periplasmic adaptor subunit [Acetobacteraceae bacterium]
MAEAENAPGHRALKLARMLAVVLAATFGLTDIAHAQQPRPSAPAVPVTVTRVTRQDVPHYLYGLGSVQAFNSVLVRARVDGTLMQVPVAEGQEVKQGDVLAIIDPRPFQAALDAATAKRAQDQADLTNAKQDLVRYSSLAQSSFASRQQVDTQQAIVNRLTAMIAADDAAMTNARLNLSYCTITSPIEGRAGLRMVDAGNMVRAADATGLMTITQVQPISVLFTVPQDNLPRISLAMAGGRLPVTAVAADGKTELDKGLLLTPDNTIDPSTGTIRLKATFPNPKNTLWPGQFVNAWLLVGTDRNALTVPSVAVQHGPTNLYVYVVKPDSTVTRQVVEVARDTGMVAIIAKGLTDDQTVVTDGQSRLQQGSRVAANEAGQQASTSRTGG